MTNVIYFSNLQTVLFATTMHCLVRDIDLGPVVSKAFSLNGG